MLRLAYAYARRRPLATLLNVVLLAVGVATITLVILLSRELDARLQHEAAGIDLVVGAKGSPLQLILAGIYHADVPPGNIPLAAVEALRRNPLIREVIPLALGDSYRGYRIVGTEPAFVAHYAAAPAQGALWTAPMEVVLGSDVARVAGLSVGGTFTGSHGLTEGGGAHEDAPYRVVGVLAPTGSVIDRLVLTSIESVWEVHHDDGARREREVTVLLVQYASPLAAAMLPRQVNSQSELQAASPAYETARLFRIVGIGVEALRGFAVLLILAAGLSVFIALYGALEERRYELAVMRALGASPARLFGLLLMEGLVLALLGAALGVVLGHALTGILGFWLESQRQYPVNGMQFRIEELWVAAVAAGVGLAAALAPAWRACRTDVSRTLAQG